MAVDIETLQFGQAQNLWLLVVPAVLLILWSWQLARRIADVRRLMRHRRIPVRERIPWLGDLAFWLCVILATASTIVALARPSVRGTLVRVAGADLVILQDASASMRVPDVQGDRWRRSMAFLRVLGNSLSWRDDRIALALFARIATPQVRLTRDPTTFFFFLDNLDFEPPVRLEDETGWDTNIELGIHWGLQLVDRDADLRGPSSNAQSFVLISDGQAFSGEVARALEDAKARAIPVFVVGVGTTAGGIIPQPTPDVERLGVGDAEPIRSSLDRQSLRTIAASGGGPYLELDREEDLAIATSIIEDTRRRAHPRDVEETADEVYWLFLVTAACLLAPGVLFLRERTDVWLQLLAAGAALLVVASVVG